VSYEVINHVSLGLAYRYVDYRLDVDRERGAGRITYRFSGPSLFLRLAFERSRCAVTFKRDDADWSSGVQLKQNAGARSACSANSKRPRPRAEPHAQCADQ
jgi:hypothetical protein